MSNKKLKRRIKELEKYAASLGDMINSNCLTCIKHENAIIDGVNDIVGVINHNAQTVEEIAAAVNGNATNSEKLELEVESLISRVSLMPSHHELDDLKRIWLQRYDDATLRITLLEEAEPVKAVPAKRRPSYDPKVAL